jgi:hypothetical protein
VTGIEYAAEQPGELPVLGQQDVAGIALPAGHVVEPDPSSVLRRENLPSGPVAWVSGEVVPGVGATWSALAARFPETGLWPLVLQPLGGNDGLWWNSKLDPTLSTLPGPTGAGDVERILAALWTAALPDPEELEEPEAREDIEAALAPFGPTFPGLATPPAAGRPEPATALAGPHPEAEGYLGLVAVTRPADAPAVMGWTGPINWYEDMGLLATVLRSWEDRYGAVVVGVGFDTLRMVARRPPRTSGEAVALAAEQFAVCPDQVWQGYESIRGFAAALQGETDWSFWWD